MTESEWRDNMSEHAWWFCWVVLFVILYAGAISWPITSVFIFDIEEKIKKLFKKNV